MHATPTTDSTGGSAGSGRIVRGALGWMVLLALCVALLSLAGRLEANRRLRHAILHGDVQQVRALLSEGANPRERLVWKETPLDLGRRVAQGDEHHPVLMLLEQRHQ